MMQHATPPRGSIDDQVMEQAIAKTIADLIAGLLYPYQLAYLADRDPRKLALWSRQIGKGHTTGIEAPMQAWEAPGKSEIMVSASEKQAQELLRKVIWWSDLVDEAVKKATGRSIYARRPSKSEVVYWNDSRAISLAANPRTVAGYSGDVFLDEAAKIMDDEEMHAAVGPITSSGPFAYRMTSSAWGARGIFWKACTGQLGRWNLHKVTIHDAVAQGCPRDIAQLRSEYDALTFSQEFECVFLSRQMAPFSPDLLRTCSKLPAPEPPTPGARDAIDGRLVKYAVGVDVGRTSDRTSIVWGCEYPQGVYQQTNTEHLRRINFAEQYNRLMAILANPAVDQLAIDATGVGMQLAEDLHRAHPDKVRRVTFTNANKSGMVSLGLAKMESGQFRIGDPDTDLLSDFATIERKVTQSGVVTYQAPRNSRGHGDSAWACLMMLSLLAGHKRDFLMDFGDAPDPNRSMQDGRIDVASALQAKVRETMLAAAGLRPSQQTGELMPAEGLGLFSQEDLDEMDDDERAFYGIPPRKQGGRP